VDQCYPSSVRQELSFHLGALRWRNDHFARLAACRNGNEVRVALCAVAAHQDVLAIARPRQGLTALAVREQRFRLPAAHRLPCRTTPAESLRIEDDVLAVGVPERMPAGLRAGGCATT